MQELISHLVSTYHFNELIEDYLNRTLRVLHFPKGADVIVQGAIDDSIYFIRKGVWRTYLLQDGEEITLWFSVPGDYDLSPWCQLKGLPSRYSISSSCNSEVVELRKSVIEKLSGESIEFARFMGDMYGNLILKTDEVLVALSSLRATDRYLAVMQHIPELFKLVPQKEVARFLGITPQSLSRIRAGIKNNAR